MIGVRIAGMVLLSGMSALPGTPPDLAPPVTRDAWISPAPEGAAEPVWGIRDGISVGLPPTQGPRGLIRVYAPYTGQPRLRPMNFIAIEPVVDGIRGKSELERSSVDGMRGKLMWSANELAADPVPIPPWLPAAGKRTEIDGVRALTFFIYTEPFENGAQCTVQVILREDRPFEVGFKVTPALHSDRIDSLVLTATMGNYARLRKLWLRDEVVDSESLWRNGEPGPMGFFAHKRWPANRMLRTDGNLIVAATSDEKDPASADYGPGVHTVWHYAGRPATQYWRVPQPDDDVFVQTNGRSTYWASDGRGTIPGGISYENFEIVRPFEPGQEVWFGISPDSPDSLGFKPPPTKPADQPDISTPSS